MSNFNNNQWHVKAYWNFKTKRYNWVVSRLFRIQGIFKDWNSVMTYINNINLASGFTKAKQQKV